MAWDLQPTWRNAVLHGPVEEPVCDQSALLDNFGNPLWQRIRRLTCTDADMAGWDECPVSGIVSAESSRSTRSWDADTSILSQPSCRFRSRRSLPKAAGDQAARVHASDSPPYLAAGPAGDGFAAEDLGLPQQDAE